MEPIYDQVYSCKLAQYLNISKMYLIFNFGTFKTVILMKDDYILVIPVP